ncbi:MAG: response regulator transcription factor [Cyclobacteriaceae bacterium]
MKDINILVVEDDPNLGQILQEYLDLKGYATQLATDGEAGLQQFETGNFDFCILDIMMPKKDGFTLAKEIRQQDKEIPIIFLTAKSMKEDTITGLKVGADDYLTKPFSMEELLLRIRAIMRRIKDKQEQRTFEPQQFAMGNCRFNYDHLLLNTPEREIKLTAKESDLLRVFCKNLNHTVDRSDFLKEVWKDDSYFNARSMDVYIAKLRKYLKDDASLQILTVHGQGFKLVTLP